MLGSRTPALLFLHTAEKLGQAVDLVVVPTERELDQLNPKNF